ncbi:MAG TPA: SRPBCC domain-containing protein [Flavobacteriaceae bacterium]|nr:SRPBCC domain-containing protein [Flavobacteriaceae bacterium]HQU22551.1 SRPBCC domain-containing protein [Flavobacteriaceae bacterium]HQU66252.1 SRPBCC domain-containing protein [Flavobacteriaceae bacterium]HRW45795.1 SRPBCC domain-containing protein [Flavobacteriaceae bacterium]
MGGSYCARMEAKDGSFGFDFEATYDEVVVHKKLSFTIADGRKVTVLFSPSANETAVSVTFEPETQNPMDLQRNGWQAILDHYRTYVNSL